MLRNRKVQAGVISADDVTGELGDLIIGRVPGRTDETQITVCDLTGVGVQERRHRLAGAGEGQGHGAGLAAGDEVTRTPNLQNGSSGLY